MVDAAAAERSPVARHAEDDGAGRGATGAPAFHVHGAEGYLAAYADFCETAVAAPPQSAAWIRAWADHVNSDVVIATLERDGAVVYALPLEIVEEAGARVARYAGGSHANGNFAPGSASFLDHAGETDMRGLVDALHAARPDIDFLHLGRQLPQHGGHANPLASLGSEQSADVALAVDLEGGFDALLARASGKRKRKKFRNQTRKFEAAGGFRCIRAETAEEADRLLDAYLEMKRQQFARMGVDNPFAEASVVAFFRALFRGSIEAGDGRFVLDGLEVGGRLRAVTGSSAEPDRIVCDFAAFADDELAQASPGEFLFFCNIEAACAAGLGLFDFSVGDEGYKRLWQPFETFQFDTIVPLTAKGRLVGGLQRAMGALRRAAKSSPTVRRLVKRVRASGGD